MSNGRDNAAFSDENEKVTDGTTFNPIIRNKDDITVLSMSADGSTLKAVCYSFGSVEANEKKTSEPNGIAMGQIADGSSTTGEKHWIKYILNAGYGKKKGLRKDNNNIFMPGTEIPRFKSVILH